MLSRTKQFYALVSFFRLLEEATDFAALPNVDCLCRVFPRSPKFNVNWRIDWNAWRGFERLR